MVYLIHFFEPLAHARHYVGYTESAKTLDARLEHHKTGNGSRLMAAVSKAGIEWTVVRTWKGGDRNFERWIKDQHNAARFCPVCRAEYLAKKRRARQPVSAGVTLAPNADGRSNQ